MSEAEGDLGVTLRKPQHLHAADELVIRIGSRLVIQAVRLMGEPLFWLAGARRQGQEIDVSRIGWVLVIRPDEIGHVATTTPIGRELRRNLPEAWITLVVKPSICNLVELCPYVNDVLRYD